MKKSKVSMGISLGVRLGALILLVFFFLPAINVSCQGSGIDESVDISQFDAAIGQVDADGEDVGEIDAAPWLFVTVVLSLAIGIIASKWHIVSMICALGNIGMIFVFKASVHHWIERKHEYVANFLQINVKPVFILHIVICGLIFVALAFDLFIWRRIYQKKMALAEAATSTLTEENPASCAACGYPLVPQAKFCVHCGAPVVIAESADTSEEASAETPVEEATATEAEEDTPATEAVEEFADSTVQEEHSPEEET